VAIRDGRILIGLEDASLVELAQAQGVIKAARPNFAAAVARDGWAATTVSATMLAASAAGIRAFATGGIGGVHRRAPFDVSSDLEELARTPMVVVCAGPKAILDVPATLEYLETRGVPVVVVGQDEVPGFYARRSGVRAPQRVDDEAGAVELARVHLDLGLGSAMLVCVPVPAAEALPDDVARDAVERAIAEAETARIHGPELTPWLLARVAALTGGASVRANTALISNNAGVAARIAGGLAAQG
jgi:pseudouridine-5'-phosphate glycosidase